jgi:hypothetical protein
MAEHVAYTSEIKISYKILIVQPEEKIPLDIAMIGKETNKGMNNE